MIFLGFFCHNLGLGQQQTKNKMVWFNDALIFIHWIVSLIYYFHYDLLPGLEKSNQVSSACLKLGFRRLLQMKPIFDKLEKQEQREKIFIPRGSSFNWKIFLNVRQIPKDSNQDISSISSASINFGYTERPITARSHRLWMMGDTINISLSTNSVLIWTCFVPGSTHSKASIFKVWFQLLLITDWRTFWRKLYR